MRPPEPFLPRMRSISYCPLAFSSLVSLTPPEVVLFEAPPVLLGASLCDSWGIVPPLAVFSSISSNSSSTSGGVATTAESIACRLPSRRAAACLNEACLGNRTSFVRTILPDRRRNTIGQFCDASWPRYTPGSILASNVCRLILGMWLQTSAPNTPKYFTLGFSPRNASNGVMPLLPTLMRFHT